MILQEHAVAGAADTYKRGSLYLSKLGVKPLPMGERMKDKIKGKTMTEKKHMENNFVAAGVSLQQQTSTQHIPSMPLDL